MLYDLFYGNPTCGDIVDYKQWLLNDGFVIFYRVFNRQFIGMLFRMDKSELCFLMFFFLGGGKSTNQLLILGIIKIIYIGNTILERPRYVQSTKCMT